MQIVRSLAGYTYGRSDLVRRAMSKKKTSVMEKERQNFVYGNPEENVLGCVANGIDVKVADHIYDEMIDFAKYAFNKSHAACYAVVAYQTAWLKYHYPNEFMAALITSIMDNLSKVSEYIAVCKQMNLQVLPPDVNEGESSFSVSGNSIRYGLSAIRSVGRNVIDAIVTERAARGPYKSLQDFIDRMNGREINKRTVESLIKAGAMDSLPGTRKQKMMVYTIMMDDAAREKKTAITGQMSLFDFVGEEEKSDFETHFPEVGEYDRDTVLAFEKEVLGIYVSGHPLEADAKRLETNITARSIDFEPDEETGASHVGDGDRVTIGGMIEGKTIKSTKSNQMMAFVTLEDLFGTLEVILFPKDFEKYRQILNPDQKVFIQGRVSAGDGEKGKLICERMIPFEDIPKELWIQFEDMEAWNAKEQELLRVIASSDGTSPVVIYIRSTRQMKRLPMSQSVLVNDDLMTSLSLTFGPANVRVVEKPIENRRKMN